jgi:hypothetical protein
MPQVISRHSARILCEKKDKKEKEEKELIDKYVSENGTISEEKNLSVSFEDRDVNQKK